MKTQSYDQYVAVSGSDFVNAVEELNKTIESLARDYVENTMIDSCNYLVHYKKQITIPENESDFRVMNQKEIHCVDCPHYRPILKEDGTADKRSKHAMCSRWGHKILKDDIAEDKCYRTLDKEAELEEQQYESATGVA